MYFLYKAIDKNGKQIKAYMEADNEKAVINTLKRTKLTITLIKEVKKIKQKKIKSRDLLIFTRLFSRLINSNVPVLQGLSIIIQNTENRAFNNVITGIITYIEQGDSLSTALGKFRHVFSPFYCGIIKAGEASGKLGEMLDLLFKYINSFDQIKKRLQSALIYPVFVLSTAFIILSLIFVFVVPQFKVLFDMFDSQLPPLTELVLGISHFFNHHIIFIFSILIISTIFIKLGLNTKKGKIILDKTVFKIPLIGSLIRDTIYTRFCQIFSILISSNVDILKGLKIAKDVMNNHLIKKAIQETHEQIKKGTTITDALDKTGAFSPTIIQMVKAGEESGQLDRMMESAAQFYEENLNIKIDIFSSLLQPVLIILIGLFITAIIISIFLPIFQLSSILH